MNDLAKTIYTNRSRLGLSQQDLAAKLGVSRQSVSKWETGAALPELDKLVAMSELFGLSLDEMVGKQPPKPAPAPQANTITPQKLTGIILMAVCLLATPLFIAFVNEWMLWMLILLPLLGISVVLMLAKENVMYKCALVILWPVVFILEWGVYILPISFNVMLWRLIVPFVVLALTKWGYRTDKKSSMSKLQIILLWAVFLLISMGGTWLIMKAASSRILVLMYTLAEPLYLLLASCLSIKTIQSLQK